MVVCQNTKLSSRLPLLSPITGRVVGVTSLGSGHQSPVTTLLKSHFTVQSLGNRVHHSLVNPRIKDHSENGNDKNNVSKWKHLTSDIF